MKMEGWADYLHTSFYGEHVLFPGLRLTSLGTFISAALLATALCLLERYVITSLSSPQLMQAQFADLCAFATLGALLLRATISHAQSGLAVGALRSRDAPTIVRLYLSLSLSPLLTETPAD